MSIVTGVTVITHCLGEGDDVAILEAINERLREKHLGWWLTNIADHAGGGKHPQTEIFAGGFNGFFHDDEDWFLAILDELLPKDDYAGEDAYVAVFHREEHGWRVCRPSMAGVKQDG